MGDIEIALAGHAFEHLFIECLGWDRAHATVLLEHNGVQFNLVAVAQKRAFSVFVCPTHRTVLANRPLLRELQRKLRKNYHEHILIYFCETPRKQVWQWATTLPDGRRILHREHPFFSNQPPPRLLVRIRGLAIRLDEEEQTTLPDVLDRVRRALLPDSEFNLFAKHPSYATRSDALAMGVKRGESGALGKFVEFHIPLARRASRMLVRWFGMGPDDAEQTAMIGLLEAARRFDPERGYQFSTYAGYWIRQACQRYGLQWGMPIRVPDYLFWHCYKLLFIEACLIATYGEHDAKPLFAKEVQKAGVAPDQWAGFCQARRLACFSDVEKEQRAELGVVDPSAVVEDDAVVGEIRCAIRRGLESLKPRQAEILKLRYGLNGPEHTLQEVADGLGITRERVRQIQAKAEQKLERRLMSDGYRRDTAETNAQIDQQPEQDTE
jgi:RNA polymerase sigma factor (sigma-70 family)